MNILISIKEKWAEAILDGHKTIELRRTCPRKAMMQQEVCLPSYEPAPLVFIVYGGMVRGECRLEWVHFFRAGASAGFLLAVKKLACVTEEEWQAYRPCYAWRVSRPVRYAQPVPLAEIGLARSPQSWQYLTDEQAVALQHRGEVKP